MYIRRTQTKTDENGEAYYTHRLVASVRIGGKVRQKTLLNLGRHFSVPREQWPSLVQCIEQHLSGQASCLAVTDDQSLEELAQHYARQLLEVHGETLKPAPTGEELQTIDVGTLQLVEPRSVGCEHILLEALRRLHLDQELERYFGKNQRDVMAAIALIVARAAAPGSERASYEWLQQETALGELLTYDFTQISLSRWYRMGDQLLAHRDELERHLSVQARALFGVEQAVVLYDLTNTYFEGTSIGNDLTARGHSKEKRHDCPLVTLGVVLDEHGFINRTRVFEGNINEGSTLETMLEGLRPASPDADLLASLTPLVILDAGIATAAHVEWLRRHQYRYLVVSRERHRQFDPEQATVVREEQGHTVRIERVVDPATAEVRLYCHSQRRESKDRAIIGRAAAHFEEALRTLHEGLGRKRTVKAYDKIQQRIGRLKEKYARAAQYYRIEVERDEETNHATAVRWVREELTDDTFPGVYCLRTNQSEWDNQTLWQTYTTLTELESVFRSLKSELGLRPVYHQTADRTTSHLFITVLAYHLIQVIRYTLKQDGIHDSWQTLRRLLRRQSRTTITCRCADGRQLHVRKSTQPEPALRKIYDSFGISRQPGPEVKNYID